MIKEFLKLIIEELGTTGVLVVGLYGILYKPVRSMAKSLQNVNHATTEIVKLLNAAVYKGGKNLHGEIRRDTDNPG